MRTQDLSHSDGIWYKGNTIAVPNVSDIKLTIMRSCHDSVFTGHMGRAKTIDMVKRLFWWPRMDAEISGYVKQCAVCQSVKSSTAAPNHGLLKPLGIPSRAWESFSLDFETGHDPKRS